MDHLACGSLWITLPPLQELSYEQLMELSERYTCRPLVTTASYESRPCHRLTLAHSCFCWRLGSVDNGADEESIGQHTAEHTQPELGEGQEVQAKDDD